MAYNLEKFVAEALDSVLMQEVDFDYDIVISEDRSTDRTREIVIEYEKKYPDKIRLILRERNLGMNENFVQTFQACHGNYIALLDADDYWTSPHKLQKQVDFLDGHPECSICFHNVNVIYEDHSVEPHPFHMEQPRYPHSRSVPKPISTIEDLVSGNFLQTCSVVFRAGLFGDLPEWFCGFPTYDWPLHILNAKYGEIGYLDEILGVYRVHSAGIWSMNMSRYHEIDDVKMVINAYEFINRHFEHNYNKILMKSVVPLYHKAIQILNEKGRYKEAGQYAKRCLLSMSLRERQNQKVLLKWILRGYFPRVYNALKFFKSTLEKRQKFLLKTMVRRYLPPVYNTVKFLKSTIENRFWLDGIDFDTGQLKKEKEPLLQQNRELRVEIDDLRLQNERLRMELDRFLDLRYLVFRTLKTFWIESIRTARHIRKKFPRKSSYKKIRSHYNSSFKPYPVRMIHSIQANRPRVLHVIGNFHTGGSARLVVDLVEHLGHKYEQGVITKELPDMPGYTGLKIHHHERFTNPRQALMQLRQFKPDITHIHYLAHHHSPYGECYWKWYNNLFQAAQEYGCKVIENINIPVEPYISDAINCYTYVSDHVRNQFGRFDGQSITIYPGTNLSLFSRRNRVDIPNDCVGMVYRLEQDKLDDHSIDVFIKVAQRRQGTKAVIVGGGHYLEPYRNAVCRAGVDGAFTFTGYVSFEDLPALYEQMSIFVAPVHTESFGHVSPCAMGMGIPVVGYHVGALEEITGNCNLLAPPGDSDALADMIIELLNDRERRLRIGARNRERAERLFSIEAMIDGYSALYNGLIGSDSLRMINRTCGQASLQKANSAFLD